METKTLNTCFVWLYKSLKEGILLFQCDVHHIFYINTANTKLWLNYSVSNATFKWSYIYLLFHSRVSTFDLTRDTLLLMSLFNQLWLHNTWLRKQLILLGAIYSYDFFVKLWRFLSRCNSMRLEDIEIINIPSVR